MSKVLSAVAKEAAILVGVASVLGVGHLLVRGVPLISDPADDDSAACAPEEAPEMVARIDASELKDHVAAGTVTLVDARPPDAFIEAHIPGAISLPSDGAEDILGVESVPIPVDSLVVTYCDSDECQVSEYLGLLLEARLGCEDVRVLRGGISAWRDAGGDTEAYGG